MNTRAMKIDGVIGDTCKGRLPRKAGGRWVVVRYLRGTAISAHRFRSLSEARRWMRRTRSYLTAKLMRHDRKLFRALTAWEAIVGDASIWMTAPRFIRRMA